MLSVTFEPPNRIDAHPTTSPDSPIPIVAAPAAHSAVPVMILSAP